MPEIFLLNLYIFFLGASLGSFLNVVSVRLPLKKSLLGRSKCSHCGHKLGWFDLIPIFSFLLLKGKCRYCRKSFSVMHPLFEMLVGVVFLLFVTKVCHPFSFTFYLKLGVVLTALTLALSDFYYQIIPDEFLVVLFGLGLLLNASQIITFLPGAILGALAFLLLYVISQGRAMGYGDVKYVFVMGVILPPLSLASSIYLAFLTGGLISAILILLKKKKLKSTISFGPFLTLGLLVNLWLLI